MKSIPDTTNAVAKTDLLARLRALTEDDIAAALVRANVALPINSEVEAVELVNVVLDYVTGERARADAGDAERIAKAIDQV